MSDAAPRLAGLVATIRRVLRGSQGLRFLIVGGLNTLACLAIYIGLVSAGVPFWAANTASLIFGICCNFVLQGRFVFHDRDPRRFLRFCLFWLGIFALQTGFIGLLIGRGMDARVAGVVALMCQVTLSYFAQKLFVFRSGAGGRE